MTFLYDEQKRAAVNSSTGISIRGTHRFIDDTYVFTFEYCSVEAIFEFDAAIQREKRPYSYQGRSFERVQQVAYYVLEPSIRAGYARAWKKAHPDNPSGAILDDAKYRSLKTAIGEGMAVLGTAGGTRIPPIPDFHVGFINMPADVKHLLRIP